MKHNIIISAITGLLFGVFAFIVIKIFKIGSGKLAIICGMAFFVLLLGYLMLAQNAAYKRYVKAEEKLTSPVWLTINANIITEDEVRNANIYFCDDGITLVSLDKKPYLTEEVPREKIKECKSDEILRLLISVTDGRHYAITSEEIAGIRDKMVERGWIE